MEPPPRSLMSCRSGSPNPPNPPPPLGRTPPPPSVGKTQVPPPQPPRRWRDGRDSSPKSPRITGPYQGGMSAPTAANLFTQLCSRPNATAYGRYLSKIV